MSAENALRQSLERSDPIFGAAAATYSPAVIETLGAVGLDYVWIDLEHGGPSPDDSSALEELTRVADVADVELLVRIPSPDPPVVRKVLDAGVRTILVPRVETAAAVRQAVEAAHFSYDGGVGDRGVGIGRPNTWGADWDALDAMDEQVLVGAMIENKRALENLDDILSVPELGFVFVGPSDLSVSLGHPMEKDHPDVQDAIERVRRACLDADVPPGCIRNDSDAAAAAIEEGYRVLRIGRDLAVVRDVLGSRLDVIDR